jgi:hypothetical protein
VDSSFVKILEEAAEERNQVTGTGVSHGERRLILKRTGPNTILGQISLLLMNLNKKPI